MADALMPTISAPLPTLHDYHMKQYFQDDALVNGVVSQPKTVGLDFFTTQETYD